MLFLGMFSPQLFFSLDIFGHKNLWKEGDPVWKALHHLDGYFEKFPFQIEIQIPPGVYLENLQSISIGSGTVLEPGAYIQGPCIIGRNCKISHGAYLRGGVICGDEVSIGHSAEVKHSILLDGARATHFTYVGDSILGNQVNLG